MTENIQGAYGQECLAEKGAGQISVDPGARDEEDDRGKADAEADDVPACDERGRPETVQDIYEGCIDVEKRAEKRKLSSEFSG